MATGTSDRLNVELLYKTLSEILSDKYGVEIKYHVRKKSSLDREGSGAAHDAEKEPA